MKIPKATKKPNGTWLIQVMIDGKRTGKVFDTEKEAIAWAAAVKASGERITQNPLNIVLADAYNRYISSKEAVLSPSTVMGYNKFKRNTFQGIMQTKLKDLTQDRIQREVNRMIREGKAPKYIRNAHGLLSVILKEYRPDLQLHTMLPQKEKKEIQIPTEEEIQQIVSAAKGTSSELSVALAVWMGLRASEISGLTWDSISGDTMTIKQARVRGDNGHLHVKSPKSYSGYRTLHIPPEIKELINQQPHTSDYIIDIAPHAIYNRFKRLCEKNGIKQYRFHDLRHYNASVMIASGMPMKYITERLGHSSDLMVRQVYGHIMQSKKDEAAEMLEQQLRNKLQP